MKSYISLFIGLAIIVLETTLLQLVRFFGVQPNIMLIALVIIAVLFDRMTSLKAAVICGLLTDVLIGKGLAIHMSIYVIIVVVISSLEEKIFKDNYITPVILIVFSTLFFHAAMTMIHYFSTGQFALFPRLFTVVIPEITYNLVIGLVAYVLAFRSNMGYHMR